MTDRKSLPDTSEEHPSGAQENSGESDTISELDKVRAKRAILLISILVLGGLILWNVYTTGATDTALRPGVYIGHVSAGNMANFDLFAEKNLGAETVRLVPFSSDWPAQETHSSDVKDMPLALSSQTANLQLVITSATENTFSGAVYLSGTRERVGSWNLTSIEAFKFVKQADTELASIKRVIGFYSEEAELLAEIEKHQAEIAAARAKVSGADIGPTNQQKAELQSVVDGTQRSEKRISELTDALTQANNRLNVELKVSKAGKLVQLARESESREERWRQSQYRTDAESIDPELFSKVSDAARIAELRVAIKAEQVRVFGGAGIK